MLTVEIEGAAQSVSFVDGSSTNELIVRLPDGDRVRLTVDDLTLQKVTAQFATQGGAAVERVMASQTAALPRSAPQQRRAEASVETNLGGLELEHGMSTEFGGDFDGPPDTADENAWVATTKPTVQAMPGTLHRVSADAQGNPVVQGNNVLDKTEIAGGYGADQEEDGVGSV